MILALPVLTRLYTPEEFGFLGVFASALAIIGVVACLRFEIAIPIPTRVGDAANLLALSLLATVLIAAVATIAATMLSQKIISATGADALLDYIWLWAVGILLFGWYNGFQYWATRKKRFKSIAKSKIYQGLGGVVSQVGFGVLGVAPAGLLIGYVINISAGVVSLGREAIRQDWRELGLISISRMRDAFFEYQRFPKYSSLEALLNGIGMQFPMILVAALAGVAEAGFLLLVMRIVGTPMGMIGASVGQVYLSRAPDAHRSGTVDVLTLDVLVKLIKSGIGPLVFLGIISEPAFVLLFGDAWGRAGEMLPWLMPWFVLQFLSSPISPIMQVMGLQKAMAGIVFLGLLLRIGGVILGIEIAPSRVSEFLGLGAMIYYAVLFSVVLGVAGLNCRGVVIALRDGAPILLSWIGGGVLVRAVLAMTSS
jgi:O-antigen/teichoic acid export membrane protein